MTNPTYLNPPIHYTISEFRKYLASLKFDAWRPKFPTLHNTGVPSLKQWLSMGATPQERWGSALNHYYQGMGWHAGPHLVVCPDYVWVLCDLTKPGVSVSCWNSETFGIEMVGSYEVGGDDFATGEGAKVRDNAVAILACLSEKFGWGDLSNFSLGGYGLHFHHECVADHHACPGSKVTKYDMLTRINAYAPTLAPLDPTPTPLTPEPRPLAIESVDDVQAALNRLGIEPISQVDGKYGPITQARIEKFQAAHGCFVDGWAGNETKAAMVAALSH